MPRIDINLYSIKNEFNNLRRNIGDYKDDMNNMFVNLNKVDSVWNDDNSIAFINRIKKDQVDFLEHVLSITNYANLINEFISSIENSVYNEFGIRNVKTIKYDSSIMDSIFNSLDRLIDYLDQCNNLITYMAIPNGFIYKENLVKMENYFINSENQCIDLKNKLARISWYINNAYNNAINSINRVNYIEIDGKILEYNYHIFNSLEGKKVKFEDVNRISSGNSNKIDSKISQQELNNSNVYQSTNNTILNHKIDNDSLNSQRLVTPNVTKLENDLDKVSASAVMQNRNISNADVNHDIDTNELNSSRINGISSANINHEIESDELRANGENVYSNARLDHEIKADEIENTIKYGSSNTSINHDIKSDELKLNEKVIQFNGNTVENNVTPGSAVTSPVNRVNTNNRISDINFNNNTSTTGIGKINTTNNNVINNQVDSSSISSEKIDYSGDNSINVNVESRGINASKIDDASFDNHINTNVKNNALDAVKTNIDDVLNAIDINMN